MQGGVAGLLGGAGEPGGELGGEGEGAAVGDLEWVERLAWAPSLPSTWALTEKGSQLVGLRVKFGRLRLIRIERRRSGMPSRIWGRGSETAVIWAVSGFDVQGGADDDVAEVIGAGDRRGDHGEARAGRPCRGRRGRPCRRRRGGGCRRRRRRSAVPTCEGGGAARVGLLCRPE